MSTKTKNKKLKRRGQRNFTQKMKTSVGGADAANSPVNNHTGSSTTPVNDKKRSEYTVILLEKTEDLTTNVIKSRIVGIIFAEMKNPSNGQENDGGVKNRGEEKNNDDERFVKSDDEIKRNIGNGIYIEEKPIEEKPITRTRSMTFSIPSKSNTPSEKYLGITLDLSYLKKETGIKEEVIFSICRTWDSSKEN